MGDDLRLALILLSKLLLWLTRLTQYSYSKVYTLTLGVCHFSPLHDYWIVTHAWNCYIKCKFDFIKIPQLFYIFIG
jgi:hypothetical protein